MTPARYARIVTLFETARELEDGPARVLWLEREAGGDRCVSVAVEEMLAAEVAGAKLPDESILGCSMAELAGDLMSELSPRSLIGKQLGEYRILSLLGAGGMGEVFLAEDVNLGRKAALKLLPEYVALNTDRVARFQNEARAVSALNHPNILTLYGLGRGEDLTFLATEFIEGQTLRDKGPTLTTAEILEVAQQTASALEAAHKAGIVHRDIKPENILIRRDGLVKVLDFGLAGMASDGGVEGQNRPTPGHSVLGTPHYMSPEQISGGPVDARSDIFSLGVVLYELLAGRKPFVADTVEQVLEATVHSVPPPLAGLRPKLPARVRRAVEKAMAKDAGERYSDMREFARELGSGEEKRSPWSKRHAWWWLSAAACVVAALGWWQVAGHDRGSGVQGIAILPLLDLSGDPAQEYFAEGMTEQLITDLSRIGSLRVISRPSAMRFRGPQRDLRAIAKELNVELLLTGSVLRAGDRVRLTVQLVRMPEDRNLLAESYDGDTRDVLTLQAGLAGAVARQIRATLTAQERTRLESARQVDPETHELFLHGKFLANRLTEQDLLRGIGYFERAIARDGEYAEAYAGVSFAYTQLANFYQAPRETMPKARDAALKAIAIDRTLADPHVWLGSILLYFDWDWTGAERELKRALELNPSSADAHLLYEDLLSALGRLDEARREAQQSLTLDPLSVRMLVEAQFTNLLAGQNQKAIEFGQKLNELESGIGVGHVNTGLAYAQQGDIPRALEELRTALRLEPSLVMAKAFLAHVLATSGDRAGAYKLLDELKAMRAKRYVCAFEIATVYGTLGDNDEAVNWLKRGAEERADCMIWMRSEPWMKPLSRDPRFQATAGRVGLGPR